MSNYPDDMHDHDHDPRSPYYDDGGREAAEETRYIEILEDVVNELDEIDTEALGMIVLEFYNAKHCLNHSIMVDKITSFLENEANEQSGRDVDNRS